MSRFPGVFTFEGDWEKNLGDKKSVRPLLDIIHRVEGAKFIHKQIGIEEELDYYLAKWLQKRYSHYRIGHFAFHGERGLIYPGEGEVGVRLKQLEGYINEGAKGRVIFFDSCSTIDISAKKIQAFLDSTKARAVVGFTKEVDWLESAAFELLVLDALAYFESPKKAELYLKEKYEEFVERLGLTFHHA